MILKPSLERMLLYSQRAKVNYYLETDINKKIYNFLLKICAIKGWEFNYTDIFNELYYQLARIHATSNPEQVVYARYIEETAKDHNSNDFSYLVYSLLYLILERRTNKYDVDTYFLAALKPRIEELSIFSDVKRLFEAIEPQDMFFLPNPTPVSQIIRDYPPECETWIFETNFFSDIDVVSLLLRYNKREERISLLMLLDLAYSIHLQFNEGLLRDRYYSMVEDGSLDVYLLIKYSDDELYPFINDLYSLNKKQDIKEDEAKNAQQELVNECSLLRDQVSSLVVEKRALEAQILGYDYELEDLRGKMNELTSAGLVSVKTILEAANRVTTSKNLPEMRSFLVELGIDSKLIKQVKSAENPISVHVENMTPSTVVNGPLIQHQNNEHYIESVNEGAVGVSVTQK